MLINFIGRQKNFPSEDTVTLSENSKRSVPVKKKSGGNYLNVLARWPRPPNSRSSSLKVHKHEISVYMNLA